MRKFTMFFIASLFVCFGAIAQQATRNGGKVKPIHAELGKGKQIKGEANGNLDFSSSNKGVLLYDNGSFITNPAGGPSGSDYSNIQTGNNSFGFAASISGGYKIADDFAINATSWTIDSVAFYGYQTGSTTTSTFNDVRVRIWQGTPGTGTIVWGDETTNVMTRTHWSGCYRGSDLTGTTRPIMRMVCATPSLTLTGGSYWIEYALGGTGSSGPWAVPITIVDQLVTGNAMQYGSSAWANLVDGSNAQGAPFQIFGTQVAAACPFPSNLVVANVTTTTATASWTESGSATAWNIQYGAEGFTVGSGTIVPVTATNYNFTGLTAGTSYDVYVQANCGGEQSLWVGPVSFTTALCNTSEQCDYILEFADSYGDGWNGASVVVVQGGVIVGSYTGEDASSMATAPVCPGLSTEFILSSGSWDEECGVVIKDAFGNVLASFATGSFGSGGANNGQVLWTGTSSCIPPACPAPTGFASTGSTMTTATLSWTETGTATAWNIEYGVTGFTQGTGTVVAATANPHTISGLAAATTYQAYVQANCGSDVSTWVGPINFSTACNAINAFPYNEGFEGTNFPPSCWSMNDADGDTYNWVQSDGTGITAQEGTKVAYSESWISGVGALTPDNYLITPQFSINANNLEVKYWVAAQDPAYAAEHYSVLLSTTGNSPANFTVTLFEETLVDSTWKEITLPLSAYNGQNVYIAFRHYNVSDMYQMKIDAFSIDQANSNVTYSNETINVYPNPTTGAIYVNNAENANIYVYNVLGEVVASVNNASNFNTIDLGSMAKGTYVVKVVSSNNVVTKQVTLVK
jgi:hypothetical protein